MGFLPALTGARIEICLLEGRRGRRKGLISVFQGYGKVVKGHGPSQSSSLSTMVSHNLPVGNTSRSPRNNSEWERCSSLWATCLVGGQGPHPPVLVGQSGTKGLVSGAVSETAKMSLQWLAAQHVTTYPAKQQDKPVTSPRPHQNTVGPQACSFVFMVIVSPRLKCR